MTNRKRVIEGEEVVDDDDPPGQEAVEVSGD